MKPIVTKRYLYLQIETARQKVIEQIFLYPEREFSLSELAKEAHVAKPHIGKILDNLLSLDLVKITKLSKMWRIKANQRSSGFIKSKIIYNLNFIYQSGIIEYLNDTFNNPKAIILFGSFRKGEDISSSDIDIAIENDDFEEYETIGLRDLSEFEKTINRRIQIHKFNRKNCDLHVFNNIANGIVLIGFLEVKL